MTHPVRVVALTPGQLGAGGVPDAGPHPMPHTAGRVALVLLVAMAVAAIRRRRRNGTVRGTRGERLPAGRRAR